MSMTTLADEAPLDPDDELLVSYLDGELSRDEESSLQNRLVEDESLRKRLHELQTGWDLLEEFPDPAPSLKLVESTLELAVADIVKTKPREERSWSRFRWPMLVIVASLIGTVTAYGVSRTVKTQRYQQQLNDLAIAENLDAYLRGKDLELMRQLAASADWSAMVSAAREVGDLTPANPQAVGSTSLGQREAFVRQMPIEKLRQLNLRWDRFAALSEDDQQEVRRVADAVARQPDAELLLRTMQTYAVWIQNLPTELRDGIESDDSATRRESIGKAIEETQISISRRSSMKLDDQTIDWIYFALQQVVRQRVEDGDEATTSHLERMRERIPEGQDQSFPTIATIVYSGSFRAGGGANSGSSSRRRPVWFGTGGGGDRPTPLSPHELSTIRLVLPDRAIAILDQIAGGDPLLETMTLRAWTEEAVRRQFPFSRRDDSTWLERYNELPSRERDFIDLLPPKEILSELSRESPFP